MALTDAVRAGARQATVSRSTADPVGSDQVGRGQGRERSRLLQAQRDRDGAALAAGRHRDRHCDLSIFDQHPRHRRRLGRACTARRPSVSSTSDRGPRCWTCHTESGTRSSRTGSGICSSPGLLAVCAVALMFMYASHAKSSATPAAGNVQVYVAARDIPIGTTGAQLASGGWLVARKFAGNSVASGAVASTATLANQVAIQPTYAGEQIVARRFGTAQPGRDPVRPEGHRTRDGAPGRRAPVARGDAQAGQPGRRDRQRDRTPRAASCTRR